jgi:hypothetical protein
MDPVRGPSRLYVVSGGATHPAAALARAMQDEERLEHAVEDLRSACARLDDLAATCTNPFTRAQLGRAVASSRRGLEDLSARLAAPPPPARPRLLAGAACAATRRFGAKRVRWTPVGVALSLVAGVLVLTGAWAAAALVLVLRVTGSVLLGGGPQALVPPIDTAVHGPVTVVGTPREAGRLVGGCIAAHLLDALVLMAGAAHLASGDDAWGALLVGCCVATMLGGTLTRVAQSEVAIFIGRSPWERVVRIGGNVAGLLAAALGLEVLGVSGLALAGVPAAAFGAYEWWHCRRVRTTRQLRRFLIAAEDSRGRYVSVTMDDRGAGAAPLGATWRPSTAAGGS